MQCPIMRGLSDKRASEHTTERASERLPARSAQGAAQHKQCYVAPPGEETEGPLVSPFPSLPIGHIVT